MAFKIPTDKLDKLAVIARAHNLTPSLPLSEAVALLKASGLFEEDYYDSLYPEVKAAGFDPAAHYMQMGWREGRQPASWFDPALYKTNNPDLGEEINPFLHFILLGYSEGRLANEQGGSAGAQGSYNPEARLIVSVTPGKESWETIKDSLFSLLSQTIRPARIIVQLPRQKFIGKQYLFYLLDAIDKGVDIRWCEDLGPYSAFIPTLEDYPDDVIITCSPDYIYSNDFLEILYEAHRANPDALCCLRGSRLANGSLDFNQAGAFGSPHLIIPHMDFGLLIPPRAWQDDALKSENFLAYAPDYPDLWCGFASQANNRRIHILNDNRPKISRSDFVLSIFNKRLEEAKRSYQASVGTLLEYFGEKGSRKEKIQGAL